MPTALKHNENQASNCVNPNLTLLSLGVRSGNARIRSSSRICLGEWLRRQPWLIPSRLSEGLFNLLRRADYYCQTGGTYLASDFTVSCPTALPLKLQGRSYLFTATDEAGRSDLAFDFELRNFIAHGSSTRTTLCRSPRVFFIGNAHVCRTQYHVISRNRKVRNVIV